MHFVDAKGILSKENGINVYRGCTHGCIYCDSRSTCYQFTHDFEDIEVKQNAPMLLEEKLKGKRKRCMIGTGAMCDPYMPCESKLQITRKCLELIDRYEFGVAVQTKSDLVLRDLDLLAQINRKTKAVVQMTLTTADEELCQKIEPEVCTTKRRFEVLMEMKKAGIPTIVWMTPILPFLNDTEENVRKLLEYCVEAGVHGILLWNMGVTLREGDREYFYAALDKHFPGMKKQYQKMYGNAYEVVSPRNKELMEIVKETCREQGMLFGAEANFTYLHEFPEQKGYEQLNLF